MADTELDETLTRLLADVDDAMEFQGTMWKSKGQASNRVQESLKHAKQKLLKLIDKEVTRSRIDELKLIPMVASKKVFVGVKAKDSLNVYLKQRLAELQTIQEEGTDNG